MSMTVFYRACVIGLTGILAGGLHSALRPLDLKPKEVQTVLGGGTSGAGTSAAGAPSAGTAAATATSESAVAGATPETQAQQPRVLGMDITLEDAILLAEQHNAMFVDARSREEFEAGHVEGSFWLPAEEFYKAQREGTIRPEALNFIDPGTILIIYCGGGACDASHNTARMLQQVGYMKTHVMTDGFPAWQQAGRSVSTGKAWYE